MGIAGLNIPKIVLGRSYFEYIPNLASRKRRFTYINPNYYFADY